MTPLLGCLTALDGGCAEPPPAEPSRAGVSPLGWVHSEPSLETCPGPLSTVSVTFTPTAWQEDAFFFPELSVHVKVPKMLTGVLVERPSSCPFSINDHSTPYVTVSCACELRDSSCCRQQCKQNPRAHTVRVPGRPGIALQSGNSKHKRTSISTAQPGQVIAMQFQLMWRVVLLHPSRNAASC